jgi:hypothetical protein
MKLLLKSGKKRLRVQKNICLMEIKIMLLTTTN